jgi:hypothetical protein
MVGKDSRVMPPLVVGWYSDPVTVGAARYWHGQDWTDVVVWGDRTLHDPTPIAEVSPATNLDLRVNRRMETNRRRRVSQGMWTT